MIIQIIIIIQKTVTVALADKILKTIVKTTLDSVSGVVFVSDNIRQNRLSICEKCDSLDVKRRSCRECGCFIDEKTRVESLPFVGLVNCDLKKW